MILPVRAECRAVQAVWLTQALRRVPGRRAVECVRDGKPGRP
jgi:hypothetical protein